MIHSNGDMILLPRELAGHFRAGARDDLMRGPMGELLLLIIKLDEPTGKLATSLESSLKVSDARLVDSSSTTNTLMMGRKGARKERPAAPGDPAKLREILEAAPHFILLLTKRHATRNSKTSRLSVGRSLTSDIVLKHFSVSQMHAWLDCDEDGSYFVGDHESKNGTRVNGRRVGPGKLVDVNPGDTLMFGEVAATLCRAKTLREAMDLRR